MLREPRRRFAGFQSRRAKCRVSGPDDDDCSYPPWVCPFLLALINTARRKLTLVKDEITRKTELDLRSWRKPRTPRQSSLRNAAALSASAPEDRASSSSLCGVAIWNCRWSNPEASRFHDAGSLPPHAA